MASASLDIAYMPPDHSLTSERRVSGAQPWLEPWLVKHSSFYRKHFAKDGQTKTERRASVIRAAEDENRRRSSAVSAEAASDASNGRDGEEHVGEQA